MRWTLKLAAGIGGMFFKGNRGEALSHSCAIMFKDVEEINLHYSSLKIQDIINKATIIKGHLELEYGLLRKSGLDKEIVRAACQHIETMHNIANTRSLLRKILFYQTKLAAKGELPFVRTAYISADLSLADFRKFWKPIYDATCQLKQLLQQNGMVVAQ
jgi:hypothetical protein